MAHRGVEEATAVAQPCGDPAAIATAALSRAWLRYHSGLLGECIQSCLQSAAGAKVDQAFGLNVRARVTAVSDTDINSALRRHDEAIAALVEAYRRRAHLHERRGSLAAAHADLALARRCFIAVGATTESARGDAMLDGRWPEDAAW
jgi:hypothetical protein